MFFLTIKNIVAKKMLILGAFVKKNNGLVGILEAVWNSNNF